MSDGYDLVNQEIYPRLYGQGLADLLPEFAFKEKGNAYVSTTTLKVDGTEGSETGKVWVYANNPYWLKDWRSRGASIYNYVKSRDGLTDQQTIEKLAKYACFDLPELPEHQKQEMENRRKRESLLEDINAYLIGNLATSNDRDASIIKDYLVNERGYSKPGLLDNMEIGYLPSIRELKEHLASIGHSNDEINAELDGWNKLIGTSHKMGFPYRGHRGEIRGFSFRAHGDSTPKYLNTSGNLKASLFGYVTYKSNSDVVMVESPLDVMHANANGIENVIALGGSSLNNDQLKHLYRQGIRSITLALDNDEAGRKATLALIKELGKESIRVYVAEYSEDVKDADELLIKNGESAFRDMVGNARSIGEYCGDMLQCFVTGMGEEPTAKKRDQLLDQAIEFASILENPQNAIDFERRAKTALKKLDIPYTRFQSLLNERKGRIHRESVQQEIDSLLQEMKGADSAETIRDLSDKINKLEKQKNKGLPDNSMFLDLLAPCTTIGEMIDHYQNSPDGIESDYGYYDRNGELVLMEYPAGMVTVDCAPTHHGKTLWMINNCLNACIKYPEKTFYFFTCEESAEAITCYFLNVFVDMQLSSNNRKTIESYFKGKGNKFFKKNYEQFVEKKDRFFKELIDTGRLQIRYSKGISELLVEQIRFLNSNANVGGVFVDYIQLLKSDGTRVNSRQEELKYISLMFKDIAIETGLPIIFAAQYNRTVTGPDKMHPTAIGEAGDIERGAGFVRGMWNRMFKPLGSDNHTPTSKIVIEIHKGRRGGHGEEVTFDFNGNTGRIKPNQPKKEDFDL